MQLYNFQTLNVDALDERWLPEVDQEYYNYYFYSNVCKCGDVDGREGIANCKMDVKLAKNNCESSFNITIIVVLTLCK